MLSKGFSVKTGGVVSSLFKMEVFMEKRVELLAPAGSFEIFKAVIAADADAVYVGGNAFGARAYANNFSEEELLKAIDYAHLHHRKLYLTVNTLLKETELKEQLYSYLQPYYKQGLDAVIVQDMGVFAFIREHFPGLEIHTSTQMTVTNRYGAEMMKSLGAARVVTARELSFSEIENISQNVDVEIESFVHGALCYCFSGQCLLSSVIGGRSGNRGRCAQPCRLPYEAYDSNMKKSGKEKKPYILSPKDLCTIEMIPQLVKAGIYSFKIEGRMKQAEYAAGVVSLYRKYIDLFLEKGESGYCVSEKDYQKLLDLGNRSGFTEGYYNKHNGADMITFEQPSHKKGNEVLQEQIRQQFVNIEIKEKIKGKLILSKDLPAKITVEYDNNKITVTGDMVQEALKQPLSVEKVEENMRKTGNTPFEFETLEIEMPEAVFMPMKSLNQLRREALESLAETLLGEFRRNQSGSSEYVSPVYPNIHKENSKKGFLTASIESREQLPPLIERDEIDAVYIDSISYTGKSLLADLKSDCNLIKKANKKAYYILPAVFRKHTSDFYQTIVTELQNLPLDGFIVKNYDALWFVKQYLAEKEMIIDHNLYTYNHKAIAEFMTYAPLRITAPLELNKKELAHRNNENSELLIYGKLPLMTSAQCVKRSTSGCNKTKGITYIKDRYHVTFPVKNNCNECYNTIYNSLPVILFGQAEELKRMQFEAYRLSFTTESEKEVRNILELCSKTFVTESKNIKAIYPGEFTYGHYKRGVE